MITVKNLSKHFGAKEVLHNISFELKPGEIVGFLGPNGAGKTTLMRVLTSYLPFTNGEVFVGGYDLRSKASLIRQKIGYLPENPPLYPEMSAREFLRFAAELKNIHPRQLKGAVDKALDDCNLTDVQHQKILHLSKGTKQRVGIAQAIIHDPEILILDEPTNGLDPLQIIQVRSLIKNLESRRTVILSTHILPEIEHIAKRVIIINKGQLIADQTLSQMFQSAEKMALHVKPVTLEDIFLRLVSQKSNE